MEANTNKAMEFNNQWVKECAGQYSNGNWKIVRNRQTRYWAVRRHDAEAGMELMLPKGFRKPLTRKLDEAKRAVNQFMFDRNYAPFTRADFE